MHLDIPQLDSPVHLVIRAQLDSPVHLDIREQLGIWMHFGYLGMAGHSDALEY